MQPDLFGRPSMERRQAGPTGDPGLDQWFTPAWTAEELVADALKGIGRTSALEPSSGLGAFLAAIPQDMPAYGVEIDPEVAAQSRQITGREVIVGDFRTVELPDEEFGLIVGNPPYRADLIHDFLVRSHTILPDDGVAAFILPAYVLSTASKVMSWNEMFSLDVKMIPRSLFGRISMPLVWAKFIKTQRRTMVGLMLFAEQAEVEAMPREVRRRLAVPGTWREVVRHALEDLGGKATLREIYLAVEPRRKSPNRFWKDKVRQELQVGGFVRVDEKTWCLPETMAA